MMDFQELNNTSRKFMLEEFQTEQKSGNPYISPRLSSLGRDQFPKIMEEAIKNGNEVTLENALSNPTFWNPTETYERNGKSYTRSIDPQNAARQLALSEFNTWYTHGIARKLLEEKIEMCEVYRAESAIQPRCECGRYEGKQIRVKEIYDGHRKKYHPIKNPSTFSIPSGTNCHHTIRSIK